MNVSVIVPTYNRPHKTMLAIQSLLQQSYKGWELIVVDDGSEEEQYSYIKNQCEILLNKKDYSLIRTTHQGVSHARNLGIQASRYPWVAFLDSDDLWLPEKLSLQVQFLKEKKSFKWLHSEERWVRNGQVLVRKKVHRKCGGHVFTPCIGQCFIGPSTVIISRKIFTEVGLFNKSFPVCEDYELWLRIAKKYPIGFIDQELIVKTGGHKDQLSSQFKAMDYWRIKALVSHLDRSCIHEITSDECQHIIQFIEKKGNILLKGLKKYGHIRRQEEIFQALQLIQLVKEKGHPLNP